MPLLAYMETVVCGGLRNGVTGLFWYCIRLTLKSQLLVFRKMWPSNEAATCSLFTDTQHVATNCVLF